MLTLMSATALALLAFDSPSTPAPLPVASSSLTFADAKTQRRFDAYRARLDSDPWKYASELSTLARIEHSDVIFRLSIGGRLDGRMEGKITTDGERVLLVISDVGGPNGELASLDSRIAHELEHARQFDAGELALACDPATGVWASHYGSYDVGDEVKAWNAQLELAESGDYWQRRDGAWSPTLLKLFATERTEEARARVLMRHGYGRVNPALDSDVRFDVSSGFLVGQLVRPDLSHGLNVFGRVARLDNSGAFATTRRAPHPAG